MDALSDALGALTGPTAYVVVGVLAALEASAFVGLFVPGELGMLVGGYIAYEGRAEVVPMMVAAVVGAIVGDSVGYEIGRRLGPSIRRSRLGQRVGEERWADAERYLMTKGGRAVFLGRFIGVLRALVPALAGVSRMPYRKFLFWNALGAVIWAPSIVGLGYLAGGSYRRVEHYAGRAGLVLLLLVLMVVAVGALGRWVSRNPERVRALARRFLDRPVIAKLGRRYRAQLLFAVGRLKPGQALGLALTLQLVALALAGWAFGSVVQDVISGESRRIDLPISRALLARQVDWLTTVMHGMNDLGGVVTLAGATLVVGLVTRRTSGSWLPLAILATALVGAVLLGDAVRSLVERARPLGMSPARADGSAFPSGLATQTIAVYGGLAYLAAGWLRTWSAKVAAWTVAVVIVLLIGFSSIYLGVHWATDVLGGFALGALWLAAVLVTTSFVRGAWGRRRPETAVDEPGPAPPRELPPTSDVGSLVETD